jgi:hypothetical protein
MNLGSICLSIETAILNYIGRGEEKLSKKLSKRTTHLHYLGLSPTHIDILELRLLDNHLARFLRVVRSNV